MNPYIEKLKVYLERFPRDREEFGSVIELLCHYYTEENPVENGVIRAKLLDVGPILEKLSLQDNDTLFRIIMCLCTEYSDQAFAAGLRVGAALAMELQDN